MCVCFCFELVILCWRTFFFHFHFHAKFSLSSFPFLHIKMKHTFFISLIFFAFFIWNIKSKHYFQMKFWKTKTSASKREEDERKSIVLLWFHAWTNVRNITKDENCFLLYSFLLFSIMDAQIKSHFLNERSNEFSLSLSLSLSPSPTLIPTFLYLSNLFQFFLLSLFIVWESILLSHYCCSKSFFLASSLSLLLLCTYRFVSWASSDKVIRKLISQSTFTQHYFVFQFHDRNSQKSRVGGVKGGREEK